MISLIAICNDHILKSKHVTFDDQKVNAANEHTLKDSFALKLHLNLLLRYYTKRYEIK